MFLTVVTFMYGVYALIVKNFPQKLRRQPVKVINDCIHGHIELHPLCVKIIDTPEFQRLRFIKQIGSCYFVYPGASHNRFEHSLGVCHLAGELVKKIRKEQSELLISDKDVLCVEIAGLCHDLGHGPFSHLFDGLFKMKLKSGQKWRHEEMSVDMFTHLIQQNKLEHAFREYGLDEKDLVFIKEQIMGPNEKYNGRDKDKHFLYEIVANKRNGIDVDKWDYLARDCHMLGIQNTFDHKRFMMHARVVRADGQLQICTRDKQYKDILDMLLTRKKLHVVACKHRVANLIDFILADALVQANPHLKFKGSHGKEYTMTEAIEQRDMGAYEQLTDSVIFSRIRYSTKPELENSRQLVKRIFERRLYFLISEAVSQKGQVYKKDDDERVIDEILNTCCCNKNDDKMQITNKDVVLDIASTDFSREEKDPIQWIRFYRKGDNNTGVKIRREEVSVTLPVKFDDQRLRIYLKEYNSKKKERLKHLFTEWCARNNFTTNFTSSSVPNDQLI